MKTILLAAALAVTSCADYGVTGRVFIVDPNSGAKGVIEGSGSGVTVTGSYVDEQGNVVGGGSVFFPRKSVEIIEAK